MNELLYIIHGWIVSLGALGVLGASVAEEVISIIPSAAVQTAAGAFMMSGYSFSLHSCIRLFFVVVIPLAVGVVVGSLPYVYIARRYGMVAIDRWGKYIGVHSSDIVRLQDKFSGTTWDDLAFIMARAFPIIPSIVLAVYAGVIQMSLLRYMITTAIGVALRATFFAIVGWLFSGWISSLQNITDTLEQVGIGLLCIVIIYALWRIHKKLFKNKINP